MRTPTTVVLWFMLLFQSTAFACDNWVAMVVSVNGNVSLKQTQDPDSTFELVQPDSFICPGQQLEVGKDSRAAIYLSNNSFVRLDEYTVLYFPAQNEAASFWIELKQGVSHFISRISNRFEVKTPFTNAAVDGTEFLVSSDANQSAVSVIEGLVTATNIASGQQQAVHPGNKVIVQNERRDFNVIPIAATDAVDWAIYFPPLLVVDELDTAGDQSQLIQASNFVSTMRPDLALQALENVEQSDSAIQIARAAILLSVGRTQQADQALQDIARAEAYALRSLIQTMKNNVPDALRLAQSAIDADEQSVTAWLSMSYAQQANLNLPKALDSARQALALNKQNVIAWIRVSELQVATGDLKMAENSVEHARRLSPDNVDVLVQSGFLKLFNLKLSAAQALFDRAIGLNSENPSARLGLGLALLRQGELEAGRMQLEHAVSLDPARSVLRSYLGRAYFEEKRDDEAAVQWLLAKQMDPQDPTPYFYEGVRKLYANNPIGAIEELETSQQLNDERALYRSETLLQSDAASRSAVLARAYDEVGYDQGALLAGWEALRSDPTNSEGHRLLADKYRGNSRYESARASELLQSQLWQPLSAYPLQPQLSETGISTVEGAGPQRPGFNEYHSLFTQDGVYGAVNGYGGSDGTWGNDLVGSFLAGPIAVSLGQYHFESDGWRENADQEQDIYSGFVQWQVAPGTSVQYEYRKLDWDLGYLAPQLGDVLVDESSEQREHVTNRLGVSTRLASGNAVLININKEQWRTHQFENVELSGIPYKLDEDAMNAEVQWVFSDEIQRMNVGMGYISSDYSDEFMSKIYEDIGFIVEVETEETSLADTRLKSGYGYYSRKLAHNLELDVGLGYVEIDQKGAVDTYQLETLSTLGGFVLSSDQTNKHFRIHDSREHWLPRLGLVYDVNSNLKLRAASFQSVSRPASSSQTIEPTIFAGFNQFFDDVDHTEAQNYSFGMDFFSNNVKAGAVISRRDLDVPASRQGQVYTVDETEKLVDTYVRYFSASDVTVAFDFLWSRRRFDAGDKYAFGVDEIDLYRAPLSVNLYGSQRVSVKAEQVYYKQRVSVENVSGWIEKNSWVTNLSGTYRFRGRSGALRFGVENLFEETGEFLSESGVHLAFYPGRLWFFNVNLNI